MTVTNKVYTLTEKELMVLLKESWWNGQYESSYNPNLQGACLRDCKATFNAQFKGE